MRKIESGPKTERTRSGRDTEPRTKANRTGAAIVPKRRLYHGAMAVTRLEEWCVEAGTAEEARALLAAGAGHRCTAGEALHAELERLLDE
jgi:hypothetical protein